MNKWSSEQIRSLRLRMGWSVVDFARRFGHVSEVVANWENGTSTPGADDYRQLDRLSFHLESYCEQLTRDPLAEAQLKSFGLEQIHQDQILRDRISPEK